MQILDFPIVKFTIFLILGIVFGHYFNPSIGLLLSIFSILLLIYLSLLFYFRKRYGPRLFLGVIILLFFTILGSLTVQIHNERLYNSHYTNLTEEDNAEKNLIISIKDILKPTAYHNKYIAELEKIEDNPVSGKILLNIPFDTISKQLNVGSSYYLKSKLDRVKPASNPGQFDYSNYLEKQHIYHQLYANHNELYFLEDTFFSVSGISQDVRNAIISKLSKGQFSEEQLSIIKALLLGQRDDISKETYTSYINAGAVHILAVSGLHIGIILLILHILLSPLDHNRSSRILKIIIILIFLWGFAIVAGLSPSVTRAVTMFSAVTFAINSKRSTNIYNTLAVSVFVLLLLKPMFLFQVGFQLSYAAVIAIVALRPIFYRQLRFNNKILDYYWNLFSVTLAAQIGVLPLSLFYFHQFPALFFISNLIIIPLLGLVLGIGIVTICLALFNILPNFIVELFGGLINIMNYVVKWVSSKEEFLFQDIAFNIPLLIAAYLIIFTLTNFMLKKNIKSLQLGLVAIIVLQFVILYNYNQQGEEFIVFHKTRETHLGRKTNKTLTIFNDLDDFKDSTPKFISDYLISRNNPKVNYRNLENVNLIDGTYLLIVDSIGVYNIKSFKPQYVLLRNSPKINLNRLIDSLRPGLIIADGSNYKSYIKRWKLSSHQKQIPFHATAEKGSFRLRLNK